MDDDACTCFAGCRCPQCSVSLAATVPPAKVECTRSAGCTCPQCGVSLAAIVTPTLQCTRSAGCTCPLCDVSAAALGGSSSPADAVASKPRPVGWQERDAYGIPDPTAEEEAAEAPYLLVCHPRPEILGMCYREIERYLRVHRGWKRRFSKNGNPKPGTGPETGPWDLFLGGNKAKRVPFKRMSEHRSYSGGQAAVNYFSAYHVLDNKDQLAITLRNYCDRSGVPMESLMPETHPFQPDSKRKDKQLESIIEAFHKHAQVAKKAAAQNIWILKQSELNQGKGCVLMDDVDSIVAFLRDVADDAGAWVVQKYVHRPLLYVGNRKFDIRCWVVVRPNYQILLYREGVLRVGAAAYDVDDISNIHAHLSNHCLAVGNSGKAISTWPRVAVPIAACSAHTSNIAHVVLRQDMQTTASTRPPTSCGTRSLTRGFKKHMASRSTR